MRALVSPTDELLRGRRALEARGEVKLLQDWTWFDLTRQWGLHLSISLEGLSRIPCKSEWVFLCDRAYPYGAIDAFPANTEYGITTTFPHQEYNCALDGLLCRTGKVCLSDPIARLGRSAHLSEPFDSDNRLLWHIDRLSTWIKTADANELLQHGDRFELPHFPRASGNMQLGFNETGDSFAMWRSSKAVEGTGELVALNEETMALFSLRAHGTNWQYSVPWGEAIGALPKAARVLWLRLPELPLVQDWTVPMTWAELSLTCGKMGVDLMATLKRLSRFIRDGAPHFFLLGLPIPARFGEADQFFHWQALQLPALSNGTVCQPGFRTNEEGFWQRDLRQYFDRDTKLQWVPSSNWNENVIQARGKCNDQIADKRIALVGCGSLGSTIAELLVRLGCRKIALADADNLKTPNLSRHTLSLSDVGKNKAKSLAMRLNSVNPLVEVKYLSDDLDAETVTWEEFDRADIIIDCTASDGMLQTLSMHEFGNEKSFVSISMSYGARRLYCYRASGKNFPLADFNTNSQPWLKLDAEERSSRELEWEAPGCWHPLFPARLDDIFLLGSLAVKWIERHTDEAESLRNIFSPGIRIHESIDPNMNFKAPSGVSVVVADTIEQDLFKFCKKAFPVETGGIIYGQYAGDGLVATVEGVTGQPKDSRAGRTWFHRGVSQLQSLLNSLWTQKSYYLGEWHFHPNGLPLPSAQDLNSLESIANSATTHCSAPIMLIVAGTANQFDYKVFIVKSRSEFVELEPSRLD